MRTETEMYDLLLSIANNDERIRAVYLNGSRANPNAPKAIRINAFLESRYTN